MSRTITNSGTVGIKLTNPADNPVTVVAGVTIASTGTYGLYGAAGTAWSITNFGTVSSPGTVTGSAGITLASGGHVLNGSTLGSAAAVSGDAGVAIGGTAGGWVQNFGTITGEHTGVSVAGAGALIDNFGTITTGYGNQSGNRYGIALEGGGRVVNGSATDTHAAIYAYSGAVIIDHGGTFTNFGSVGGYNSALAIKDGYGVVFNAGGIGCSGYGSSAVSLNDGGRVTNTGFIEGFGEGVVITGATGTVINTGGIGSERGGGVYLGAGGLVVNGSDTDRRAGMSPVGIAGGAGTVLNYGTISGGFEGGNAVYLSTGTVMNGTSQDTSAYNSGVVIGGDGTVVNYGTIGSQNYGGEVSISGDGTVADFGTIIGITTAVVLGGVNDRLILGPAAVLDGAAIASGTGDSVLELAHGPTQGQLSGIGFTIRNFDTIAVDSYAKWAVSGVNFLGGYGSIQTGFDSDLSVGGTLVTAGYLTLEGAGKLGTTGSGLIEIGTAGNAAPGAITVDPGATLNTVGQLDGKVGTVFVQGRLIDLGVINVGPGSLALAGNVSGDGLIEIDTGSVLRADRGLAPQVQFVSSGTVKLNDPLAVSSLFSSVTSQDTIDLLHHVVTAATFDAATGVLTATDGTATVASLHFAGSFPNGFAFSSDGHGGTNIVSR